MSLSTLTLMLFLGALATSVLGILNSALQLLRRADAQAGWFSALLAFLAAFATVGVLLIHAFLLPFSARRVAILAGLGAIELVFGLLLLLFIERRRAAFAAGRSYGLLAAGIGFLAVVAALLIPVLPGQLFPSPTPTPDFTATATSPSTATLTPTPFLTATTTATPTSQINATPTTRPPATPTRQPYQTSTPPATPTAMVYCGAIVNYNLNLRTRPSVDAAALLLIPYTSIIQVGGRNSEGSWWFVGYNEIWGWVDAGYITLDTDCDLVPVLLD